MVVLNKVKVAHTHHEHWSGADPGHSRSAHRWQSHIPVSRLPLLSARPAVTFLAREHHRHLVGTKLYCLVTEAHVCEQLAHSCYLIMQWPGVLNS